MRPYLLLLATLLLTACGTQASDLSSAGVAHAAATTPQGAGGGIVAALGGAGYGNLRFGVTRMAAEHVMGDHFVGPDSGAACQQFVRADSPGVHYLFLKGLLQRIDVESPEVMAEGGGRVGMEIDDIRSMYAGRIEDSDSHLIFGGHVLRIANSDGSGLVFDTNGSGIVIAMHAGTADALERPEGCSQ